MIGARYPSLEGRAVFITGGASGIGAALVEAFVEQGACVVFVDVDQDAAPALCERLGELAGEAHFIACDISDVDALKSACKEANKTFGPVRVLINNAGSDTRHAIDEVDAQRWDQIQAVNLRPHFFTAQAFAASMAEAGGGSIINLSSNSFILKVGGMPGYLTAKAGIIGLTRALARELGPQDIRANALLPGWVMTERQRELWVTPEAERELLEQQCIKRTIEPRDVADLALFLAADDSAMITGQNLVVDGGRT